MQNFYVKGTLVDHRKSWWLVAILVAVLSAFIIPYTVLSGVDSWYGSFLFWMLITAVVIAINGVVSSQWRDE